MAPAPLILMLLLLISGSAAAARPLVVAAGDSLVLEGATLTASRSRPAALVHGTLILRDCVVAGKAGGASLLVCEGDKARLVVERCRLWARPRARRAGWSKMPDEVADTRQAKRTLTPPLVELRGGRALFSSSTMWAPGFGPLVQVAAGATARLRSCLLGGGGPGPAIQEEKDGAVQLSWSMSDRAARPHDPARPGLVQVPDLRLVDPRRGDLRLRWDSPALEAGDPDEPWDFDLTRADIGWTPKYEEVEVSGTTTLTERGWYKVIGYTTFTGTDLVIPEGTTIRNDDGYTMIFSDTDNTNGYNIVVGDPDGARTAIVGSLDSGSISFGSTSTAPSQAVTSFNGVLFNRAPDFYNGALCFRYCDVDLNGASGNVKFNAYQNTEVIFDAVCYGQFRNFDFTATHIQNGVMGIGCIDVQYSDVDVLNNTFDRINDYPNNWYWKLMHYGTVPNPSHIIASNQFNAQDNGDLNFPVLLGGATLNLHHNVFDNVEAGAILAATATLNMKNGANNQFFKEDAVGYENYPMIEAIQTWTDLECGYNAFAAYNYAPSYQFIVSSGGSSNWAYNFWGEDCDNGESPENHIPGFVSTFSPWLATCPTLFVPCQGQGGENDLYAFGQEAAEIENHEAAVAYWIELLEDYPESKYCTEVTGIIKAIGLYTEYGAEDYPLIRAGLESAADESEPVDDLLSIFQVCSAWCVEAMHGDRPAAEALLDSLLIEKDGYAKAELLINTALAEIATYPEQGQMSALGPEMEAQRIDRRRQALRNLQRVLVPAMVAAGSPAPGLDPGKPLERPSTFGIRSCHPNPFNPTTTLDVQVDGEEALSLEIFNTLGQRVAVLHEGVLPAGAHTFRWTAGQAATGVYLARAVQGQRVSVAKVILVR